MVRSLRWFANLKLSALEFRITAVAAYGHLSVVPPEARVEVGDKGLVLHPSRPPALTNFFHRHRRRFSPGAVSLRID
jgi:hypothetical protein